MKTDCNTCIYKQSSLPPHPCPECGHGMIVLSSMDKKLCDCGYSEPHKLKKGQKSILINNLKGE